MSKGTTQLHLFRWLVAAPSPWSCRAEKLQKELCRRSEAGGSEANYLSEVVGGVRVVGGRGGVRLALCRRLDAGSQTNYLSEVVGG